MTKINFTLDTRVPNQENLYPVKVRLQHNGTISLVSTGVFTSKRFFIGDPEMVVDKREKNATDKNCTLYNIYESYQSAVSELESQHKLESISAIGIREYIKERFPISKHKVYTFTDALHEYMNKCEKSKTWNTYYQTMKKLQEFHSGKILFSEIDYAFLDRFFTRLEKIGLKINSRHIIYRNMRAVWNYADRMDMIHNVPYPFKKYKMQAEMREKEYLPLEKMRKLVSLQLDGALAAARDFFLLQFYFCGVDPVDLFHMPYQEEKITFKRIKIIGKNPLEATIKIQEEAQHLINIYKGNEYLLHYADRRKNYETFLRNTEDDLYRIGEMIGYKLHFRLARYTWATYAGQCDVPEDVIGRAMGHKPKTMCGKHYITFDWSRVDRANRCVIDYLQGKDKYMYQESAAIKIDEMQETIARLTKIIEKLTA